MNSIEAIIIIVLLLAILIQSVAATNRLTSILKELRKPRGSDRSVATSTETLSTYLSETWPDREAASKTDISEFAAELVKRGYRTIADVDSAISRSWQLADEYEEMHSPGWGKGQGRTYSNVGIARSALAISDKDYGDWKYPADSKALAQYRRRIAL